MDIKLGSLIKDITTGFTGIAWNRMDNMNGNVQYSIQPEMKEGSTSYPDAMNIDHHLIDVLGEGISSRVTEVTFQSPVKLGQRVRDIVSGFEGIATHKTTYMNGCVAFLIHAKGDKENGESKMDWVDQTRVEVVDDGVLPKIKPAKEASNGKKPGGASSKTHRML